MSDRGLYDMRRKLLELQSELQKNATEQPASLNNIVAQVSEKAAKEPYKEPNDDIIWLMKQLFINQQKILDVLNEINHKMK